MEKFLYSWSDFDRDIIYLYYSIFAQNWTPDYIVGVKRGGLIPAIALSHRFNKPLIMMSCQLRDSNNPSVKLYELDEISPDKKILIVDDICDSGDTMTKITQELILKHLVNVKNCALYYNTAQDFKLQYFARTIDRNFDNRWIMFPWENS
jgi:hypoxanthine phosphoribosyltransferase